MGSNLHHKIRYLKAATFIGVISLFGAFGLSGCGGDKETQSGELPKLCSVEPTQGAAGASVSVHVEGDGAGSRFAFGGIHAATLSVTEVTTQTLESEDASDCQVTHVIAMQVPENCSPGQVELKAFSGLEESNAIPFTCLEGESEDNDDDEGTDTDGDGAPDAQDGDDDNDGIPDVNDQDDDGDGITDSEEGNNDQDQDDDEWDEPPPVIDRCQGVVCGEHQVCENGTCRDLGCDEENGPICEGGQICDEETGSCVAPAFCTTPDFQPRLRLEELTLDQLGYVADQQIAYIRMGNGKGGKGKGGAKSKGDKGKGFDKKGGKKGSQRYAYAHLDNRQEGSIEVSNLSDVAEAGFLAFCELDDEDRPIFFKDQQGLDRYDFSATDFVVCNNYPDQCPGYAATDWSLQVATTTKVCWIKNLPAEADSATGAKFYFKFPSAAATKMKAKLATRCEEANWVFQPIQQKQASLPILENCKVRIAEREARIEITAGATMSKHLSVRCGNQSATPSGVDDDVGNYHCPANGKFTQVSCEVDGHAGQVHSEDYCLEIGGGMSSSDFLPKPQCVEPDDLRDATDDDDDNDDDNGSAGEDEEPVKCDGETMDRDQILFQWTARQKYKVGSLYDGAACQEGWDDPAPSSGSGGGSGKGTDSLYLVGYFFSTWWADPREPEYRGETGWFLRCHLTNGDEDSDHIETLGLENELPAGEGGLGVDGLSVEEVQGSGNWFEVKTHAKGLVELTPTHEGFEYRTVCREVFEDGSTSSESWQSDKRKVVFPSKFGLVFPSDWGTDGLIEVIGGPWGMGDADLDGLFTGERTFTVQLKCTGRSDSEPDRMSPRRIPFSWRGVNIKEIGYSGNRDYGEDVVDLSGSGFATHYGEWGDSGEFTYGFIRDLMHDFQEGVDGGDLRSDGQRDAWSYGENEAGVTALMKSTTIDIVGYDDETHHAHIEICCTGAGFNDD